MATKAAEETMREGDGGVTSVTETSCAERTTQLPELLGVMERNGVC